MVLVAWKNYWKNKENIHCYSECDSMEDVARYYVEETGQLGEVPSNLQKLY